MRYAVVGFILLFFWSLALGTTYYVDYSGGDDSNAGTSTGAAWKHIPWDTNATGNSDAKDGALSAGDIISLKPDTEYTGNDIEVNDSGTGDADANRITLTGDTTTWGSGTNQATMTGTPGIYEGVIEIKSGTNQYITIRDITFQNIASGKGVAISIDLRTNETANYITIKDCTINNCDGLYGMYVQQSSGTINNLTIDGITISNCANTGLRVDDCGSDLVIKNSTFHTNGNGGNDDGLFIGNTTGFLVQDCTAYSNGGGGTQGSGFDTSNKDGQNIGGTFERCYSYNNDNVGFSASSDQSGDEVTFRNCIAYGNTAWGNFVAYHNLTTYVYNCTSGSSTSGNAYMWWENANGVIKNSIASGTYTYAIQYNNTLTSDYNCMEDGTTAFSNKGDWDDWQALGHDENGLHQDPKFVASPAQPDVDYFMLSANSPCINNGLQITSFTDDYDKNARADWDIGAYEYQGGTSDPAKPTIPTLTPGANNLAFTGSTYSGTNSHDQTLVQISEDSTMANVDLAYTLGAVTSFTVDTTFVPDGVTLYTRICYVDDTAAASSWSDISSFTKTRTNVVVPGDR